MLVGWKESARGSPKRWTRRRRLRARVGRTVGAEVDGAVSCQLCCMCTGVAGLVVASPPGPATPAISANSAMLRRGCSQIFLCCCSQAPPEPTRTCNLRHWPSPVPHRPPNNLPPLPAPARTLTSLSGWSLFIFLYIFLYFIFFIYIFNNDKIIFGISLETFRRDWSTVQDHLLNKVYLSINV